MSNAAMNSTCWVLVRFCLCAWVGAASLFVVTGIREVTSDLIEPAVKNQLAAIRFPAYYAFGFVLVGLSVVASLLAKAESARDRRFLTAIRVLTAIALVTMVIDYFAIFQPLLDLMSDPTAREKPEFKSYHNWSMIINFGSVGCSLVAALLSVSGSGRSAAKDATHE